MLNSWESEGDEQEQRETLTVLCEALGRRDWRPRGRSFREPGRSARCRPTEPCDQSEGLGRVAMLQGVAGRTACWRRTDHDARGGRLRIAPRANPCGTTWRTRRLDNLARKAGFLPVTTGGLASCRRVVVQARNQGYATADDSARGLRRDTRGAGVARCRGRLRGDRRDRERWPPGSFRGRPRLGDNHRRSVGWDAVSVLNNPVEIGLYENRT